jgi:hypothetical protein
MTNHTFRKWIVGAAMLGATSAVLVGCNDGDNGGPVTSPTATATATAQATGTVQATGTPRATPRFTATPVASTFFPGTYRLTIAPLLGAGNSFNFRVGSTGTVAPTLVTVPGFGTGTLSGTVEPRGFLYGTFTNGSVSIPINISLSYLGGTVSGSSEISVGGRVVGTARVVKQ